MEKPFRIKLIIRRAPALAALGWLKQAWAIFMLAPQTWVLMFITLGVIGLVSQLHPIAAVIGILLSPFLTAGVYKCVVALQQKQSISYTDLFTPLKDLSCRATFIRLAGLNLLVSIPLSSLAMELVKQYQQHSVDISLVIILAISSILAWMVFAYAVAIAYFLKEQRLLAIMQASFIACWRNTTPLALYGLLSLVLIMLTMPTFFIGLLLVAPVLNIAFFLSFNEFFALQVNTTDDAVLEV